MFIVEEQKIQTNPLKHNAPIQTHNCQLFGVKPIRFYNILFIFLYKHIFLFLNWESCVFYNSHLAYYKHINSDKYYYT